ncbi:hypothetical protein [Chryseobacterium oranimense]|uniref:hypothetical protein n=1 Tax=Chryseobacterium oranimense TaxID=421058 RepID=UPI0031E061C6
MEALTTLKNKLNTGLAFLVMMFMSAMSFAQNNDTGTVTADKTVNSTSTSTTTTEWYTNPVYLIVGAVVLLIIIVLLTRGSKKERD